MGKDREGVFHPKTGKPSMEGKQKGIITPSIEEGPLNTQETEGKYGMDTDSDNKALLRHPNRNTSKDLEKNKSAKNIGNKNKGNPSEPLLAVVAKEINEISKDVLNDLAYEEGPCVSIYMPFHEKGAEINSQVDATRFKSLLDRAGRTLQEQKRDTSKILDAAYAMVKNPELWAPSQFKGAAFFITEKSFRFVRLSVAPEEKVWVNTSFLLTPLVPLLSCSEQFYLLVISKKQAKLFRGDNAHLVYVEVSELPNGMDDVIHFEEKEDQKLFRTGSIGAGGGANYHGIGGGKPDEKENIAIYLAEVDATLRKEILHDSKIPLLLAGVDYMVALYKKISKYNNIWESALTGSLEYENEHVLLEQAKKVMAPYFNERTTQAIEAYKNHSATQLTSSMVNDVISAAYYGRIAHLFVQKDQVLWGTFDETTNHLILNEMQQETDRDLMHDVILKTLTTGGQVHVLEEYQMPAQSTLAALMRY